MVSGNFLQDPVLFAKIGDFGIGDAKKFFFSSMASIAQIEKNETLFGSDYGAKL